MEQTIKSETEVNTECFIYLVIGEVVCHETDVARQLDEGKRFAEHNKTVFDVAMSVAKFYSEQLDLRMDAYARERKALAEVEKLKQELSRCRAMNADYLTAKTEAENRAKLLKQEIADLKVPDSRRERHLRDELHKVRIECQQAWGKCNEELVNKATVESELQRVIAERDKYRNFAIELGDKNDALKRQLDESNKQIEIYAKKVRNLEADLEEGGFNDERNFI